MSDILNVGLIKPLGLGLYITISAIRFNRWVVVSGDVDVGAGARVDVGHRRGAMTAGIKRRG